MSCVDNDGVWLATDNLVFTNQGRQEAQSVPGKPEITSLTYVESYDYLKMADMKDAWNLPGDAVW